MESFISWIGGKKLLRKAIISRFPIQIDKYVEVFGGAAWVLFARDKHANLEVYNDFDSNLVNLFRCVKYHCQELQRELQLSLNSREFFEDYKAQMKVKGLTDIQRAAKYFTLIKTSYGADRRSYGCSRKNLIKIMDYLPSIHQRLNEVVIENKSFEAMLKTYDSAGTLFYLDPPYHGTEKYYDGGFSVESHILLRDLLLEVKGKFILSYNDDDFIRNLYREFNIESISRNSNLTGRYKNGSHSYNELIIQNY